MPLRCNSQMTSTRSHSMTARWISGNETRRRSRQGGKSRAETPGAHHLLALPVFQPDQKTVGQHHRHRVPMKAFPHPALMLIPTQFAFRFFMILLDPTAPMLVLDHLDERRRARKITPVIMMFAPRLTPRAFADQPADVPRAVSVYAPTAHRRELGFERDAVSVPPTDHFPVARTLWREQCGGAQCRVPRSPARRHLKVFPHRRDATFVALLQTIEKVRVIAIVAIRHHARERDACRVGFVCQVAISALVWNSTSGGTCALAQRCGSSVQTRGR